MITFLKGVLQDKGEKTLGETAYLVVDVNGVGYMVLTSAMSLVKTPEINQSITVYTSMIVREDAMQLVGFPTKEERELFDILLNASGVGVKHALSLLSCLNVSELSAAIMGGDHKRLSSAKGIGPKLAQKIALELKEKMTQWREKRLQHVSHSEQQASLPTDSSEAFQEAETVLMSLGYGLEEVFAGLRKVQENEPDPKTLSSEEVLQRALKWLAMHSVS